MKKLLLSLTLLALTGCATVPATQMAEGPAAAELDTVQVRIIGINDFHGHLDPPKAATDVINAAGEKVRVPSGGAAYLASAIDYLQADAPTLKPGDPYNVVVAAGDLIGASPLSSSLFLDEPSIMAMDLIGLEFNAVGNHEFDRGTEELLRMQAGGCDKHTLAEPCRIDKPFPGAKFRMLAANTKKADGSPLFPPYALKSFGSGDAKVTIGFIGMTTKSTSTLVSANRIKGVSFADEADTANALVPKLKAAGADVIVVLIHEGVSNPGDINQPQCDGVSGALLPIVERLDPAISIVISGHTHQAYACHYKPAGRQQSVLLTSAGSRGQIVTAIDLNIDPTTGDLLSRNAQNMVVQSEAFSNARESVPITQKYLQLGPRADVAALASRYREAAKVESNRIVGTLAGPATRDRGKTGESLLGNLIADAQLAATADPENGGAQIAFMNPDGIRAEVAPGKDSQVSFGSVFAAQPFGNTLITKTLTGKQILDVLEQQLNNPDWYRILSPSTGFRFGYDLSRPVGQRIVFATLNGVPLDKSSTYRVAVSDFLSNGGDGFSVFKDGTDPAVGQTDLEAFMAWLSRDGVTALPALDRVENKTPQ